MMQTEKIFETLVFNSALTHFISRKDFSTFILRENFKSYSVRRIFPNGDRAYKAATKPRVISVR
jgi:hypothetical protein